ncbi:transcription factor MafA [Platysternon megacephalum]|uniref:Transcription factor MafA n=1 Tax=Platysternon megacephalum TaxID=55544 RepID=A0A4D9E790_9SAUR|nr:transcription factor MafA [Platysternon megacephalum]
MELLPWPSTRYKPDTTLVKGLTVSYFSKNVNLKGDHFYLYNAKLYISGATEQRDNTQHVGQILSMVHMHLSIDVNAEYLALFVGVICLLFELKTEDVYCFEINC